ncbi:MAG: hypothetical protein IH874_03880 [Candidatus Dadabacteria bacterium]|nr:hypothetical protein [Candidatus Dadabacteria bacterium]
MGSMTDFLELELLDHVLRNEAFTSPTTVYIGLFTAAPGEAGGGTEVSGGSYARQAIAFDAAASRTAANTALITFPVATANWGTITDWAIFDAVTTGNMLWYGVFDTSIVVNIDDEAEIAAGDIDLTASAAGATDFLVHKLIDHSVGTASYTAPTSVFAALFTTATTDAGGGTEVTGGSYAREVIVFDVAAAGATDNSVNDPFPTATADWGTITHAAIMSLVTGGDMLFHAALTDSRTINNGQNSKFNAGDLDITLT